MEVLQLKFAEEANLATLLQTPYFKVRDHTVIVIPATQNIYEKIKEF